MTAHSNRVFDHICRLTPRERQVAGLLAAGLSNPQIAARLGIRVETAKAHVSRVLSKMGAEDRLQVRELLENDRAKDEGGGMRDEASSLRPHPSSLRGDRPAPMRRSPSHIAPGDLSQETRAFLGRFNPADRWAMLRDIADLFNGLRARGGNDLYLNDVVEVLAAIGLLALSRESLNQAKIINWARHKGILPDGDERR